MKIYKQLLLTLLLPLIALTVSAQNNYVQQDNVTIAGVTTDVQLFALPISQRQTTRTYTDGLGRAIQTIAVQAGVNTSNDVVQPIQYDNLGRQTTQYLPYVPSDGSASGSYRSTAVTDQSSYYNTIYADPNASSSQVFENSPLQRLLEAGNVGSGYQPTQSGTQHYKTVSYRNNTAADDVLIFSSAGTYTAGSYYAANALSVTDGKDEDGVETMAFTDYTGHTILKRQLNGAAYLDTYYIYGNGGQLAYMITPKGSATIYASSTTLLFSSSPLKSLIYSYVYDTQGRLQQKTVPTSGTVYMIYDPLNRPVLIQDANLRQNKNWYYIKYDIKGRPVSQGIYNDVTHTTAAAMQTYVNGLSGAYATSWYESRSSSATNKYYTNVIFPTTGITPLAFSFFDDYDLLQNGTAEYAYVSQGLTNEETQTGAQVKGMPTMMLKCSVGSGLSSLWMMSVMFYDRHGNVIQTQSNNQLYYSAQETVTDYKTLVPDFVGRPQQALVKVASSSSVTNKVLTTFSYDAHLTRIASLTQQYNSQTAVTIAAYAYNDLGQLTTKSLGNTTGSTYLQTLGYTYNIRGQVLSINSSQLTGSYSGSVFGMQYLYDGTDSNLGNTAYYSGRISAVKWMSKDGSNNNSNERSYKYSYDSYNRLTASSYAERVGSTGSFSTNVGAYNEDNLSYDENGNIKTLNRNSIYSGAIQQVDQLQYTYAAANPDSLLNVNDIATGSQKTAVGFRNLTASTGNYTYDVSGNLSGDPYKGMTLTYNVLNKTDKITITTATNRWIDYTYDGSGSVIRKRVYDNNVLQTTTDYIGGFVYINSTLAYLPMPEGRVVNNSGTLSPEYIITDLQGNARISFNNTGTGGTAKVVQENSYTGFGLILANSAVTGGTNKNLYNGGSEWQNDYTTVLPDYYETFYRNYDAAIGRFVAVDPKSESAESMTPYQYAENNPVMMNDPGGDVAPRNNRSTDSFSYDWSGRGFPYGDDTYGGGGGGGAGGGPTLSGWYQDHFDNSDGFLNYFGNGFGFKDFLNSLAEGVAAHNGDLNVTISGQGINTLFNLWMSQGLTFISIVGNNDAPNGNTSTNTQTQLTRIEDDKLKVLFGPSTHTDGRFIGFPGLVVEMFAKNLFFNPDYDWIQVYSRDSGPVTLDQNPDAVVPFYYNATQLIQYTFSYTSEFIDFPGFNPSYSGTFSAQTTLVSFNLDGTMYPVESVNYSMSYIKGNPQVDYNKPLLNTLIWWQTLNYINQYNNNLKNTGR